MDRHTHCKGQLKICKSKRNRFGAWRALSVSAFYLATTLASLSALFEYPGLLSAPRWREMPVEEGSIQIIDGKSGS